MINILALLVKKALSLAQASCANSETLAFAMILITSPESASWPGLQSFSGNMGHYPIVTSSFGHAEKKEASAASRMAFSSVNNFA